MIDEKIQREYRQQVCRILSAEIFDSEKKEKFNENLSHVWKRRQVNESTASR